MKRFHLILLFIGLIVIISSCEREDQYHLSVEEKTNWVDSSLLEHNMVWNGHYYQLDFTHAYTTVDGCRSSQGNEPAKIKFYSFFKERYHQYDVCLVAQPYVSELYDQLYPTYQPGWAKTFLPRCEMCLTNPTFAYGFIIIFNNAYLVPGIVPQGCTDNDPYQVNLNSFDINDEGIDHIADYNLSISGRCLELDLVGQLRAQG